MLGALWLALALASPPGSEGAPAGAELAQQLRAARTWHYQLQRLKPEQVAQADRDVLVIDPEDDEQAPWSPEVIAQLKRREGGAPRVVLAYMSIGEAETYRADFDRRWRHKRPAWLLGENPEWAGNHPVLYWDEEWQALVDARVDRVMAQGFDGLYLDRVDVNRDLSVVKRLLKVHPQGTPEARKAWRAGAPFPEADRRMAAFVTRVAARARSARPGALVVPQNGSDLVPVLLDVVDGWAVEDTFFDGNRRARRVHTEEVLAALAPLRGRLPVFVVDYVRNAGRIRELRARCTDEQLIPYAAPSRALDRGP